jgi:hypothetical protein
MVTRSTLAVSSIFKIGPSHMVIDGKLATKLTFLVLVVLFCGNPSEIDRQAFGKPG